MSASESTNRILITGICRYFNLDEKRWVSLGCDYKVVAKVDGNWYLLTRKGRDGCLGKQVTKPEVVARWMRRSGSRYLKQWADAIPDFRNTHVATHMEDLCEDEPVQAESVAA